MANHRAWDASLVVCVLLLSSIGGAWAQRAGLNVKLESSRLEGVQATSAGTVESLQPLGTPLESILGGRSDGWALGQTDRDLYKLDLEWGASDRVSVKRNVSQKRVAAKGRPFDTAVQELTEQSVGLTPFAGMSFSMSRKRTETTDLGLVSLGATEVEATGLAQKYGSGRTAGALSFKRTVTETLKPQAEQADSMLALTERKEEQELRLTQGFGVLGKASQLEVVRGVATSYKPDDYTREQASDAVRLSTGLWAQTSLAGVYERSHSNQSEGLHSQHRNLALSRKFATGEAKVAYDFTASRRAGATTETTTQGFNLPLRIDGKAVAAAFSSKTVQNDTDVLSDERKITFASKLAGNDVTASWARNIVLKSGQDNKTTSAAFALPMRLFGDKASFSYTSNSQQIGAAMQKKERVTAFALPLSHVRAGTSFSYQVKGLEQVGKDPQEMRTARLLMPLSLFGTTVATESERTTTHTPSGKTLQFLTKATAPLRIAGRKVDTENQFTAINRPDGTQQDQFSTRVSIPFRPGAVVVQRQAVTDTAADGTEKQMRTVTITAPRVALVGPTSVQADMEMKAGTDGTDTRTTHLNLQAKPVAPVTLSADYRLKDLGPDQETTERQLDATYALSDRLSLNARYLDREQLDRSPFIQRTMVVQRKAPTPGDLRLRAAVTSTDDGAVDGDLLKVVEVGFGDPKALGVNVKYQEYDEAKLVTLGDPVVEFGLEHGDIKSLNWTLGYGDSKSRPAPRRHYGIGFPMGDTSLKLAFSQNPQDPTDPKAQRIRVADMYDAALSSKVFGDLALDLGYRYCAYPEDVEAAERVDQWLQIKLTGGKSEDGGAVQIGYASGDFVTLDKTKPERTPLSTLSVRYEKKLSDLGSISLNLNRTNVPESISDLKDSYEGRLQFEHRF